MTIEDLREYRYLKSEIEVLELEIQQLYYPVKSPSTSASGGHSGVSNPTEQTAFKAEQLRKTLDRKTEDLRSKVVEIEDWLETIDDARVRASIRWHFIFGLSWRKTTEKVYGQYYSDKVAIKAVTRYLKKVSVTNVTAQP